MLRRFWTSDVKEEVDEERRTFLELTAKYGFTAAVAAAAAGTIGSRDAAAQTAQEEREREEGAEYQMLCATAYRVGSTRGFPVMQLNFKENVQNLTFGKVYVKLSPGGALGVGTQLAQKVQAGTIQVAMHSLSNFAPFASAVDLINIPYWCGYNQQFVNLVTSDAWRSEVESKVEANGFKPLLYLTVDPRTASMRQGLRDEPFRTPEDLKGVKFRVPGSKILAEFYRLLGANPTPVAWGETPSAIKQGVADALDPSVEGLWLFGFQDILSYVTFNRAVPDGQVYSCNLEWLNGLDQETRDGVLEASEVTFHQNLGQIPASRAYAMAEMANAGVQFYQPTDAEMEQWIEAGGHQRSEWDPVKEELAGSLDVFQKLLEAAEARGRYYVHDI